MMAPLSTLAWSVAAIFATLSLLHVYWAFGGHRGAEEVLPEREGKPLFRPSFFTTLVVAALLATAALLVIERAGVGPGVLPRVLARWGTWGVAVALTARGIGEFNYIGLLKRRRQTRFARLDTRVFSPLALALGVGSGIIAWTAGS